MFSNKFVQKLKTKKKISNLFAWTLSSDWNSSLISSKWKVKCLCASARYNFPLYWIFWLCVFDRMYNVCIRCARLIAIYYGISWLNWSTISFFFIPFVWQCVHINKFNNKKLCTLTTIVHVFYYYDWMVLEVVKLIKFNMLFVRLTIGIGKKNLLCFSEP